MVQNKLSETQPPKAPKLLHTLHMHGQTLIDQWHWLKDLEDPSTLNYLSAENNYTDTIMAPTSDLQTSLYTEMRNRIKEDDSSVPQTLGEYLYHTKYNEGSEYPIHCRKHISPDGEEEIILDINELSINKSYIRIGFVKVSPDHKFLAYSSDENGSESFKIYVKDLTSGTLLSDEITGAYYSFAWANDSTTFFYTTLDINHRPVRVRRHKLGSKPETDETVYEERDSRFFVGVTKSASKQYIFIATQGNNMSEWHYLNADTPNDSLTLITAREPDIEYDVEHSDDSFLIRHNRDGAKDFKISKTPIDQPDSTHWKDHWPHQKGRPITDFRVFQNYYAIAYRESGLPKICIQNKTTNEVHDILLDQEDYNLYPMDGTEWDSDILRFGYSSLTTPTTIYDYSMSSRHRVMQKQSEVLGSFSQERYVTKRIYAPSSDGALIPISLVHRIDIEIDHTTPLYLYGYGAYGIIVESDFSSLRLSLLDRGFIFAIAHIRGGMDLGWEWYEHGKLLNKKNTFNDFIDVAEYLISKGYTSPRTLVACGGSAGGLLMGAIVNLRPDLFQAIISHVPFVDIMNTMLDDTLPLTTMEYNEWGNPNDPAFFNYIKSYSPYDNVIPQERPHMLVTGGISDPRVTYWEPTKWVAALRDARQGNNMLLLKIHMESGHSGASGRFSRLKEVALEYAFILTALDIR